MTAPPQWQDRPADEFERVLRWRYSQFRELGFSCAESRLLADSEAELQHARDLRKAGCPLTLIERIVA